MPDLANRREHEAAIAALLLREFDAYRRSGQSLPALEAALAEALVDPLTEIQVKAATGMLTADADLQAIRITATSQANTIAARLASEIVATSRKLLDEGQEPSRVFSSERAEKIAATETTRSVSAGETIALAILMIAGTNMRPIWHTERDGLVCPICRPLHLTGAEVYGRVSPTGPPAHPNCRCHLDYEEVG